jgi:hypothetical protein
MMWMLSEIELLQVFRQFAACQKFRYIDHSNLETMHFQNYVDINCLFMYEELIPEVITCLFEKVCINVTEVGRRGDSWIASVF